MRAEFDFSKGKRGAVITQKGKTRITIFIDNAILAKFRKLDMPMNPSRRVACFVIS